jgi:hypothetical protein
MTAWKQFGPLVIGDKEQFGRGELTPDDPRHS